MSQGGVNLKGALALNLVLAVVNLAWALLSRNIPKTLVLVTEFGFLMAMLLVLLLFLQRFKIKMELGWCGWKRLAIGGASAIGLACLFFIVLWFAQNDLVLFPVLQLVVTVDLVWEQHKMKTSAPQ